MNDIKPGVKTTEFWLQAAAIAFTAISSVFSKPPENAWDAVLKSVAVAVTVLGALGYGVIRTKAKS